MEIANTQELFRDLEREPERVQLHKTARIIYISIGVLMVSGSFVMALEGWERFILPVVGGGSIVTGGCGW